MQRGLGPFLPNESEIQRCLSCPDPGLIPQCRFAQGPDEALTQHVHPNYSSLLGIPFTFPGKAAPPVPRGLGVQPMQVDDSGVLRGPNTPSLWPPGFASFPKSLSQPVTHPQPPSTRQAAQSCVMDCEWGGGIWPLRSRQASSHPHHALGSPVFLSLGQIPRGLTFLWLVLALAVPSVCCLSSALWGPQRSPLSVSMQKR